MEEKEISKIFKSKRKLIILLLIYLSIAIICIGIVIFMASKKKEKPLDLSELIYNNEVKERQYVEFDIEYLPRILSTNIDKDKYFYYIIDEEGNIYVMKLSTKIFNKMKDNSNPENEKLDSTYHLEGITYNIDSQIEKLVLASVRAFTDSELNSNELSKYLCKVYIDDNRTTESDRIVTLYQISGLFGLFFLILAFGYIIPAILKTSKVFNDKELVEELRIELENITDTPYKKYRLYLTQNYIINGIQAIRYEDIIWGYITEVSKYGIKLGQNLIVYTKDKKEHTIGSVGSKNNILNNVLSDMHSRNTNIRVGYNEENKEFFANYMDI